MSNDRGRLVIISGPTASGKSTLWRHLVGFPNITFSISATTRAIRGNEVDGRDYKFVSSEEFDQLTKDGEFLEWAEVHGERYGTLRSYVLKAINAGKDILLEIDVQGAEQLRDSGLPVVSLFVAPPSIEVLRERLAARGTESAEQMEKRLSIVEEELRHTEQYDHVVINDHLDDMLAEVESILGLEVTS